MTTPSVFFVTNWAEDLGIWDSSCWMILVRCTQYSFKKPAKYVGSTQWKKTNPLKIHDVIVARRVAIAIEENEFILVVEGDVLQVLLQIGLFWNLKIKIWLKRAITVIWDVIWTIFHCFHKEEGRFYAFMIIFFKYWWQVFKIKFWHWW